MLSRKAPPLSRAAATTIVATLAVLISRVAVSCARTVSLSNVQLPLDQHGNRILTGEANVLKHNGAYYFYFNDWGSCPGVDCCGSSGGCASCCFDDPPYPIKTCQNPYEGDHVVQAYRTVDFENWEYLGVALGLDDRPPGVEFRPCVVFNPKTQLFVMWYEDRPEHGYAVATSTMPGGPFTTKFVNVSMPGTGKIGDFNIFLDNDGSAYHVRTGFDIVRLNENFTGASVHIASFNTPKRSEGPTMFRRGNTYYITAGTDCCACIGGSSIYVLSAPSLKGPWNFQGDIGSNPTPFNQSSPNNYVTRAQGSAVFLVDSDTVIWLGNQWNSGLAESPPGARHHDLLYWAKLAFDDSSGAIKQLAYETEISFDIAG